MNPDVVLEGDSSFQMNFGKILRVSVATTALLGLGILTGTDDLSH